MLMMRQLMKQETLDKIISAIMWFVLGSMFGVLIILYGISKEWLSI